MNGYVKRNTGITVAMKGILMAYNVNQDLKAQCLLLFLMANYIWTISETIK